MLLVFKNYAISVMLIYFRLKCLCNFFIYNHLPLLVCFSSCRLWHAKFALHIFLASLSSLCWHITCYHFHRCLAHLFGQRYVCKWLYMFA